MHLSHFSQVQAQGDEATALDGLPRNKASKKVNVILHKYSKGIFSDAYWKPVHDIRKAMEKANIPWIITKTEYSKDDQGRPNSKTWKVEVPYMGPRGKKVILHGQIVASGAGSVEDPLDKYDVTAYVS
jgi:hypothetical protein